MDKGAIKNYAVWARRKLIEDITQKAFEAGVTEDRIAGAVRISSDAVQVNSMLLNKHEAKQREALVKRVKEKGFEQVMEEAAFTWFNRIIAIRFMEVNGYLPTGVRVLSSTEAGKAVPDIITNALHLDLGLDLELVHAYLDKHDDDELFRYLFTRQCNKLNEILPGLFEKIEDYTELLLPNNLLIEGSVIRRLVSDIPGEDFQDQVEIIGWLYQYYISEKKDQVFAALKKNVKITKENIPAATQLFTPAWIVKYMVENSLGRLWLESHPNSTLREGWKYYLDEAEQTPEVAERLRVLRMENAVKSPEDIKVIDPCMGSGHILVYAFDVLMRIYTSVGYSERDAAKLILEKNLYGLEIDRRAYQLAYFALMMKGRQYNRRVLTLGVRPQVYEPTGYGDGMEYGSLVRVDKLEPMPESPKEQQMTMFGGSYDTKLNAWHFRRLLAQKYDIVVTNPPYMNSSGMNSKLSSFVKNNYQDSKSDISFCFMEKCLSLCSEFGIYAMINIPVWMNISSCENLRNKIIQASSLVSMLHFGRGVFGSDFGSCSFVFSKLRLAGYTSVIQRLYVKQGGVDTVEQKEEMFFEKQWIYKVKMNNFLALPGYIIAYTLSDKSYEFLANSDKISKYATARQGMATADNNRFLRLWFEVSSVNFSRKITKSQGTISDDEKWVPYSKGGAYCKWFGNNDYVVNWQYNGMEIRAFKKSVVRNPDYYFMEGLTWTALTAGSFSMRYQPSGFAFDSMGPVCFPYEKQNMKYLLGVLNSKVGNMYLNILCPNFKFDQKPLENVPFIIDFSKKKAVDSIVDKNISIAQNNWDSCETSGDFICHPLISGERTVAAAFSKWEREATERFDNLKANEEELNRIFIDIYGLQDELKPEVEDKDVTVRRADLGREIRSLISYAVGCMFGRYSLDSEGLAYAGGEWNVGKYKTFPADKDNIIPVCDDEYFDDDIVSRLIQFLRVTFGKETLEENLDFIAGALGRKASETSRQTIRRYFLKDFFKDHVKIYQKRPIYWLFDSGKEDGFKALIYMHRYDEFTVARVRTDYLHRLQRTYEAEARRLEALIDSDVSPREKTASRKKMEKLQKQMQECLAYDQVIAHVANQRLKIDLDDGVKVNYAKFQGIEVPQDDGKKPLKANLLAKI